MISSYCIIIADDPNDIFDDFLMMIFDDDFDDDFFDDLLMIFLMTFW